MYFTKSAKRFPDKIAIVSNGNNYTYADLKEASSKVASLLLKDQKDLSKARVAFMVTPGFEYVAMQWGIWLAGGVAVPLCLTHPQKELEYVLENAQCSILICDEVHKEKIAPLVSKRKLKFFTTSELFNRKSLIVNRKFSDSHPAMILYTSGTTSKPKGVVITHGNIEAQVKGMIQAWCWTENDIILNVLPLHHVHGITNVVTTGLCAGATVDFLPKFDAAAVWGKFIETDLTIFMAVPTIYYKLIEFWEQADSKDKKMMRNACKKFRLMVSGSAALPVSTLKKWKAISGHVLLERYGMTEIGMALSNPLKGERRPGHVGMPMPGVEVKLVDENFQEVEAGEAGQILVKGPNVFKVYWNEPDITKRSFHNDWFKTGDMAILNDGATPKKPSLLSQTLLLPKGRTANPLVRRSSPSGDHGVSTDGYYKIIGRSSVDIIKSGGYKISALEVEEVLRTYPVIKECAVVGIPDKEWGEVVAAAIVVNGKLSQEKLTVWMKTQLAIYKIPRKVTIINELPKNALGKVVKPQVKKLIVKND